MMLELLVNKRLRENYNTALELKNEEDIKNFLSELSEKERHELLIYANEYVVEDRIKKGTPTSEYFLLHCEDFMSDTTKQTLKKADKHLSFIFLFIVLIVAIIYVFK